MVSKIKFDALEYRVYQLETGGLGSPQLAWLQSQLGCLDPANKSLCFKGFQETEIAKRTACIERFLESIGGKNAIRGVEHIAEGPYGDRVLTPVSVVELACRTDRERALKNLQELGSGLKDTAGGSVSVTRAMTSIQLKRNASLLAVVSKLKKDSRCKDKVVEVQWQIDGSKNRDVQVDGNLVFAQLPDDVSGNFLAPFEDVSL